MSNEFEQAFNSWVENRKKRKPKKFFLKFNKEDIEVSLEKYLEVTRHGIEKYEYKNKKIVLKPIKKAIQLKPTLAPAEIVGYHFYNGDPFWVTKHNRGGCEWVTEQE